ncbi:APC family permease [soil metagenome]
MTSPRTAIKRALLGRPRSSRELGHQLLPRWMALPVFSSDPLSSVAYATQEMMLVLALAGAGAFSLVLPLSGAVALLMVVVITSYRQTVRAYPHGGGAYIVARENLGDTPGLVAGAALLIDYALTVAVSIAAGVAAITSAAPGMMEHRAWAALGFLLLVALANLRGVKEAGLLFALPTYTFVATILTLVLVGVARCGLGVGGCPQAPSAGTSLEAGGALTLFLVLRAFSSGATALTGVEAISNGVTAFRYPQSRNAASTLGIMGVLAVSMFLGISYLARATGVVASEGMARTVVAEIALTVFGEGPGFYLVQVVTAAILILAANTAFADFPRLASVLARDRFLPRQFLSRGDRLAFSNGIVLLSLFAALLLVVYGADVTELIQLYVVGVFTSFTLSQAGMVLHWRRVREPGWQRASVLNAAGAVTTGVVLMVVAVTKFLSGAWIVLLAIPLVVLGMRWVHNHYAEVSLQLRAGVAEPEARRPHHAIVLLDRVDEAAARALSYALATSPTSLQAFAVPLPGSDVERRWRELAPEVPVRVLQGADQRGTVEALATALHAEAERHGPGAFTTAIVPETLSRSWAQQLLEHRLALRLKARLLREGGLVVTDLTSPEGGPGPYTLEEPVEHHVVVLVAGVHKATMRALAYAQALRPTTIRALSVNLEPDRDGLPMLAQWEDWGVDVPLELIDSPFRSLSGAVRRYVQRFVPDGRHTIVTCVLPEFVLEHAYHQPLHNQTALLVKAALLFERGVVTTSVPYHLHLGRDASREVEARGTS